jgi:hypothetical protein
MRPMCGVAMASSATECVELCLIATARCEHLVAAAIDLREQIAGSHSLPFVKADVPDPCPRYSYGRLSQSPFGENAGVTPLRFLAMLNSNFGAKVSSERRLALTRPELAQAAALAQGFLHTSLYFDLQFWALAS